ncbi:hypothetical protein [Streptomyces sp. NPDC046805]|uniref:hypothetical protein n=1 Tax=Streptomyces sp. NPDC046805 TaxID=3155134 RepID=UPI0033C6980B
MAYKIARRAAAAAAAATVAAAGLLAAGGSASAATLPTGDRTAVVSQSTWIDKSRDTDWRGHWGDGQGRYDQDGRGYWVRDDDGRVYWVRDDDARFLWVLGQIYWVRDHDGRHYWVREHAGRSYRWDGDRWFQWNAAGTDFDHGRKYSDDGASHHREGDGWSRG